MQFTTDEAGRRYREAAGIRDRDLVVVGSGLRSAAVTAFAWPAARLLRTTGTDAADHLLLDDLTTSLVRRRFERAVGSGDGIFAGCLAWLRATELRVEGVAPDGSVSLQLAAEANLAGAVNARLCRTPLVR